MNKEYENLIAGKTFDSERSLYAVKNTEVRDCVFAGPADGESALKETRNVKVDGCGFSLRYPLWHTEDYVLVNSSMDELTRAAIWYAKRGYIENCNLHGIKCLRECDDTEIVKTDIVSPECGWRCRGVSMTDCTVTSEYFMFEASDLKLSGVKMKGKYSFQYVKNMTVDSSDFDTKDAFWHSENVTVRNSRVKGEYLGWYSKNLTLIDCEIIGTQPLCYCEGLKLVNCTMKETDLSFEYSEVEADIIGEVMSVKNPKSGRIVADGYGDIILEDSVIETNCRIEKRQ